MINFVNVNKFCNDDVSLIENYNEAINSKETYVCHHRLEIELDLSVNELIKRKMYYNRPASELIFLTKSEHSRIHTLGKNNPNYGKFGEKNPMYGKSSENFMAPEAIKAKREKHRINSTGRAWMTDGENNYFISSEQIDEYLNKGCYFGCIHRKYTRRKKA